VVLGLAAGLEKLDDEHTTTAVVLRVLTISPGADKIATLSRFIRLELGKSNSVDCAIAELTRGTSVKHGHRAMEKFGSFLEGIQSRQSIPCAALVATANSRSSRSVAGISPPRPRLLI
jgi:hypothetical protein